MNYVELDTNNRRIHSQYTLQANVVLIRKFVAFSITYYWFFISELWSLGNVSNLPSLNIKNCICRHLRSLSMAEPEVLKSATLNLHNFQDLQDNHVK